MPIEQRNRETVRRVYEEMLNAGHFERAGELVADDYAAPDGSRGAKAFSARLTTLRGSFPDIHYTLDDLLADGDRVAVRWTWEGTHQGAGPFSAIAATGKHIENTGMAIYTLRDGKITGVAMENDRLGFLLAVGAVAPSALPAGVVGPPGPPPSAAAGRAAPPR